MKPKSPHSSTMSESSVAMLAPRPAANLPRLPAFSDVILRDSSVVAEGCFSRCASRNWPVQHLRRSLQPIAAVTAVRRRSARPKCSFVHERSARSSEGRWRLPALRRGQPIVRLLSWSATCRKGRRPACGAPPPPLLGLPRRSAEREMARYAQE